eukprot:5505512-Prymnesium_polylepis.3
MLDAETELCDVNPYVKRVVVAVHTPHRAGNCSIAGGAANIRLLKTVSRAMWKVDAFVRDVQPGSSEELEYKRRRELVKSARFSEAQQVAALGELMPCDEGGSEDFERKAAALMADAAPPEPKQGKEEEGEEELLGDDAAAAIDEAPLSQEELGEPGEPGLAQEAADEGAAGADAGAGAQAGALPVPTEFCIARSLLGDLWERHGLMPTGGDALGPPKDSAKYGRKPLWKVRPASRVCMCHPQS